MRAIPSILAVAVTAAGLAGATYGAFEHEWKAVLAPVSGSKITGQAELEGKDKDKSSEAEISIKGATAGAELPWHVHTGKCGSSGGIVGDPKAYALLKVDKKGEAKGEAKLAIATPESGDYHVNVHKSAAEMGTIVSCGDLARGDAKPKSSGSGY